MAAPYPAYQQQNQPNYPYPPSQSVSPNNYTNDRPYDGYKANIGRDLTRTPSPTPSEAEELSKQGAFDWQKLSNWRFWIRREWLWYYVAVILITVLVGLITIYHTQIVHWLKPAADWMHQLRFGWLVPIAVLFVLSFPPLFGHEIVAVICGLVWGLWIGFALVAAGTFVGEVGNFYAFKYCCRARGEKLEKTQIPYACLARVVRDGGFKIALVARLSAIPGHFTTAVFSTCGMGIITFAIAAVLSLPKQFITVYLGVILEQSSDGGTVDTKTRIIDYTVIAITTIITIVAMWYIYWKMGKVKPTVIYDRRKARQAKLQRELGFGISPYSNSAFASTTTVPFNVSVNTDPEHQHWDKEGRAIGYSPGPIAAPQPYRPNSGASDFNDRQGGIGSVYPMAQVSRGRDGRLPVRTESEESVTWDTGSAGHEEGYEMPRVVSPPGLRDPFNANERPGQSQEQQPSRQQQQQQQQQYAPPAGPPPEPVVPAIPPPPQTPRSATENHSPYTQVANLSPSPTFHGMGPHPAARVASPAILPSQSPAPGQFAPYSSQQQPGQLASYPSHPYSPPQGQPLPSPSYPNPYGASPVQTPTQANFATQQMQGQYTLPQAQTQYTPPQPHQMQSFHAPEASDASFYTAHPGPHSRDGTMESGSPLQPLGRVLSPPPPSYHTMQ